MKKLALCLLVAACAAFSTARATDTIYTDMPTFVGMLRGTSHTEDFNAGNSIAPSFSFSSNGFAYTVTTSDASTY